MAKREIEETGDIISDTLPSGIPFEIQELNAEAEKALTNKQDIKSGKVLNKLMRRALVSFNGEPMPANDGEANSIILDMKSGDRNYLLLQIRMQSYGEDMPFNYKCPECKKTAGYQVNLRELLDDGTLKVYPYREDMPLVVETRAGVAEIEYPTGRTEQWMIQQDEIDTIKRALAYCKSFNGQHPTYAEFSKLLAKDLTKIRLAGEELKGGLDPTIELTCPECDNSYDVSLYQIVDFLSHK